LRGDAVRVVKPSPRAQGLAAAFLTPLFLGVAPIFGKLAITAGVESFTVAALRTVVAVALLWIVYGVFFRRYIYIYPAGLLGCTVVGAINGIGSLFFYSGLGLLDVSLAQLLNGMYIVFAVLLARVGGERIDRRVVLRVALALIGMVLITGFGATPVNWLGVGLMLASALMFAGTVILSQYVMYEMPSTTATLYILTTMGVVVVMVWAAAGSPLSPNVLEAASGSIILLGVTTAFSRIAMFASVQLLGSLRTAVIAVAEIGVALALAFFVLGERLTPTQWVGVGLLIGGLLLMRARDFKPHIFNLSTLLVRDVASIQFQRIAFHRAFGTHELDNEFGVMSQITTSEMQAIARMMGAKDSPVDPFPLARNTYFNAEVDLTKFLDSTEGEESSEKPKPEQG
jgi:drug/metabolite transporter (DMT)-like permease